MERPVHGTWVVTAALLLACAPPAVDPVDWDAFRRRGHGLPAPPEEDIAQPHLETPPVLRRAANAVTVGDVLVVEGDNTTVSTANTPRGNGWGIRMDEARRDMGNIARTVVETVGDRFDFITVVPAFDDLYNPGLAYYATVRNPDEGFGVGPVDVGAQFGSPARLQGFINLNRPQAYTDLDNLGWEHPDSAVYAIMGQEMGHRWLAYARFQQEGFNNNLPSQLLLGRDNAHWSALMHTGPANPDDPLYVSVEDGMAWRDNGNGSFTAVEVYGDPASRNLTTRARFSDLDLYLMGLLSADEVPPFFVITNARQAGVFVPATARLARGTTVTGMRHDVTMEDVVAALGPRVPDVASAPRDFTMAVVVVTRPGQRANAVLDTVAHADAFRVQWEERFHQWTRNRATLCTSLSGTCNRTTLALENVAVSEAGGQGTWTPGESLVVRANVRNLGVLPSQVATVGLVTSDARVVPEVASVVAGVVAPGAALPVAFTVTIPADFPCGTRLGLTMTLAASGAHLTSARVEQPVGVAMSVVLDLADAARVRVDPDGTDTATGGRFAVGVPSRTDMRMVSQPNVFVQPGTMPEPGVTLALVTDPGDSGLQPADVELTDVDEGVTTAVLGPLPLAGIESPTLSYWAWHTAVVVDRLNARVFQARGDDLVVEVRAGDGAWTEVDRVSDNAYAWVFRQVELAPLLPPGASLLEVRVSARDEGADQNPVESAVAALAVGGKVPACVLAGSSSSSSGGSTSGANPADGGQEQGSSSSSGGGVPPPVGPSCGCTAGSSPLEWWCAPMVLLAWRTRRRPC